MKCLLYKLQLTTYLLKTYYRPIAQTRPTVVYINYTTTGHTTRKQVGKQSTLITQLGLVEIKSIALQYDAWRNKFKN
jgi:hypothetical protein